MVVSKGSSSRYYLFVELAAEALTEGGGQQEYRYLARKYVATPFTVGFYASKPQYLIVLYRNVNYRSFGIQQGEVMPRLPGRNDHGRLREVAVKDIRNGGSVGWRCLSDHCSGR